MDTFIHYGVAAAIEALRDSGLEVNDANREMIAAWSAPALAACR